MIERTRSETAPTRLVKAAQKSGARGDEKVAQNPAHYAILPDRMESQKTYKALGDKGFVRFGKILGRPWRITQVPPRGVERSQKSPENRGAINQGDAKSDAVNGGSRTEPSVIDSDLAEVLAHWQNSSPELRARILDLIRGNGVGNIVPVEGGGSARSISSSESMSCPRPCRNSNARIAK